MLLLVIPLAIAIMTGFRARKAGKNPVVWGFLAMILLVVAQVSAAFVFTDFLGKKNYEIGSMIGWLAGIVVTFILLSYWLPVLKYLAKPPEGVSKEFTFEELHKSFLDGKVGADWVVRRVDEADYRPITSVLYEETDSKSTTVPSVALAKNISYVIMAIGIAALVALVVFTVITLKEK